MSDGLILVGFDAGQTHCRCKLSRWHNGNWQPLGEGQGSGVSHLQAAGSETRFKEAIRSSLHAANPSGTEITAPACRASGVEHGTALPHRA